MKIVMIEDDAEIIEVVSVAFRMRWPDAKLISSDSGEKGISLVESENPDAVILDLGLPDISGFDVLKQIRLFSEVPILILTARGDESDIVRGLEGGADDYVTKPFRQLELLSRMRAIIRRTNQVETEEITTWGNFRFNNVTLQMIKGEERIALTRTEGRILQCLLKNPGRVVTYERIAEEVWGQDYPDYVESLRVYIRRLREKIEDDSSNPTLILNRPGVGYTLQDND